MFKGIFKFFGSLFVFVALALVFASVFDSNLVDSFPEYKNDTHKIIVDATYDLIEEQTGLNKEQINELCDSRGEDVCDDLPDESINEDSAVQVFENKLKETIYLARSGKNLGIFLLVVGLALFILGIGVKKGLSDFFLSAFISSLFNYLFYRFALTGIVNSLLRNMISSSGQFLLDDVYNIAIAWINSAVVETVTLIIVAGVVSLVIGVVLRFVGRK